MSYSVSNLFKSMAMNPKIPDTKLDNPDIPESNFQTQDIQFIRDQAHNALRLTSKPRNGDGFLLPRTVFNNNPKRDSFLMENAIDPDMIRQKVNPISEAQPTTGEGALYGVDRTMKTSTDSINLIRNSQEQFYNYQNRFSMAPTENLPPIDSLPIDISRPNQPSKPIDIHKPIPKPVIGYTPPAKTLPAKKQSTGHMTGGDGGI
jgi:hypothetical protein